MSTAMFRPLMLTYAEMANLSVSEGRFLMTTDTHEMFIDISDDSRVKITSETGDIPIGIVSNIETIPGDEQAVIKWTDPIDWIIGDTTYSSWDGTKLVIKEGSYPISPEDGTLIIDNKTRNQYAASGYNITDLTNNTTYYGMLFPYSTAGYINDLAENRFILTPDYIYPSAATNITAVEGTIESSFLVTFTLPADATDATVVMKQGSAPTNSTDGIVVTGATTSAVFTNIIEDETYYFRVYTYNAKRRETASEAISAEISHFKIVSFADGTDKQIARMLEAHYNGDIDVTDYWSVGDTRKIHLNAISFEQRDNIVTWSGQDITIVITAMKHYNLATPINGITKAAITCQIRELVALDALGIGSGAIYLDMLSKDNITDPSRVHWTGNISLRTFLNNTFISMISSTVQNLIKPISHTVLATRGCTGTKSNGPVNRTFETVTDSIFLPTYTEVFGNVVYENYMSGNTPAGEEGTQWEYYQTSSNRIKYINKNGDMGSNVTDWWLGSPSTNGSSTYTGYTWCYVTHEGNISTMSNWFSVSIAPAFAL